MKTIRISLDPISVLVGALSLGGCLTILSMQQVSSTTGILSADQREFLQSLSMVDLDDGQGGVARTVRRRPRCATCVSLLGFRSLYFIFSPKDAAQISTLFQRQFAQKFIIDLLHP